MINITADGYTHEIEGHAGYAERGSDIVCAAVSALFCTLAGGLGSYEEMYTEPLMVYEKSGFAKVVCKPKDEYVDIVDTVWQVFLSGLRAIAIKYPQYVRFL